MSADVPLTPPHESPDGAPLHVQPRWRRDFPIEVTRDDHVTRRELTKFLILTSAAFAVGQIWIGLRSMFGRPRRPTPKLVARLADVPVGGALAFSYPGERDPCLLLRPDERTLVAFDQRCTHLQCAVQPDPGTGRLHCPCHQGWFDLASGAVLSGPPRRPLPRILLEVRGDAVYATGVELRT